MGFAAGSSVTSGVDAPRVDVRSAAVMRNGNTHVTALMDMMLSVRFLSVGLFLTLLAAGCGDRNPFDQVRVSGKITYEDGSTIPGHSVTVQFIPLVEEIDRKTHARPGEARLNVADGTFEQATSYSYGDGIAVGKHKVVIRSLDENGRPTGAVPAQYQDASTTPLQIDTDDRPFDIRIPKP